MNKVLENKLTSLKNKAEKLSKAEFLNSYSGNSDEEKVSKAIESEFNDLILKYKQSNNNFDEHMKDTYLAGATFRRRKKAIKEYAFIANNEFKEKYKQLSVLLEFCKYACGPVFESYEQLDYEEYIVEAASIYLLDILFNYSQEEKAMKYMPKDENSLSKAIINPEASDCMYGDDLIQSVSYLFQNQTSIKKNENGNLLTIELAESDVFQVQEIKDAKTNKEKLLSILSLVPNIEIDRVVNNFRKDLFRLFEIVLEIESKYQEDFNDIYKETLVRIKELEKEIINANTIFTNKDFSKLKTSLYFHELDNLIDELTDILNIKHLLRVATCIMHFDNTILEEDIEQEYSKLLFDFEISNPFETCFAFMYLLTINDNITWLLNPCVTLLKVASLKLPWAKEYNIARDSNEEEEKLYEKRMKEIVIDDNDITEDIIKDNDDLYKLKYNDSYRWIDYHNAGEKDLLRINLPQFCFNYTNVIPPRSFNINIKNMEKHYLASGFSNSQIETLNNIYYLLSCSGTKFSFDDEDTNNDENDNKKYLNEINELNINNKNKKEKIDLLREKVNSLQSSLKKIKKEFNDYKNEYNNDKEEIYRLRELVYSLQNDKNIENDNQTMDIKLPYYSPIKAVILGGNDIWINKMKEAINNVSFLSSNQRLNVDVIKNAKALWIQIIGLSHSDFYAVTAFAKSHNIPIYYFAFSNIDKCVKQFIDNVKTN